MTFGSPIPVVPHKIVVYASARPWRSNPGNLLSEDLLFMLSWLRLPGRVASVKTASSDPDGLDAFTPEDAPGPSPVAADNGTARMRFVVGFLVLLAALQAYPSALWLRGTLRRTPPPADAPVTAAAAVPTLPAASCEA